MSTDADGPDDGDRMAKIDVRVPQTLLEAVDDTYAERGYSSRSEAVRDALRDWLSPPQQLSAETLDALDTSREQREQGETVSADAARERLGLDEDDAEE